ETFNWATDYFDPMAAGNTSRGLAVVDEDGTEHVRTFAELSERSNRVASFFGALGLKRGDRLLLMLGNEIALWETMLACMQPGDVHWNISSPGWAKHAWSCFFAPWNAGATVFILNYAKFQARTVLNALVRYGVTTLCAPPTVWRMLIQEPLSDYRVSLREVV